MKKLIFSALAAIGLLLSPSCSDENEVLSGSDNEALVSFNVQLADGISTKATSGTTLGDGTNATNLVVEVYEADAEDGAQEVFSEKYILQNLKKDVTFTLVKGKKYDIIFWAQNQTPTTSEGKYYDITDLRHIGVNYTNMASNNENRDAFVAVKKGFSISGPVTIDVKLTRPFAQVNFMVPATDIKNADAASFDFGSAKTGITISNVAKQLNPLSNTVGLEYQEVTFKPEYIPFRGKNYKTMESTDADKLNIAGTDHYYLATTYILVNAPGSTENDANKQVLVNATLTIYEDGTNETHTIPVNNIPVQMNYRTNIYGNLLTAGGTFKVEINNGFGGPDENVPTTASVSSFNDLTTALGKPNITTITLTDDITLADNLTIDRNVTIDGGETSKFGFKDNDGDRNTLSVGSESNVTFENVSFANSDYALSATDYAGNLTIKNCRFYVDGNNGNASYKGSISIGTASSGAGIVIESNTFTYGQLTRAGVEPPAAGKYIEISSTNTKCTNTIRIVGNTFNNGYLPAYLEISNQSAATTTIGKNTFTADASKISVSFHNKEGLNKDNFLIAFKGDTETCVSDIPDSN